MVERIIEEMENEGKVVTALIYKDGEEEIEYVTDMESAVAIRYATLEDYENNGFSTFGLTTNIQKIR